MWLGLTVTKILLLLCQDDLNEVRYINQRLHLVTHFEDLILSNIEITGLLCNSKWNQFLLPLK